MNALLTPEEHRRQIAAYEAVLPRYELLAKTLDQVLRRLSAQWSPLAIVQTRPKSVSSFAEKCLRKANKYRDAVNQLTDLCGGRVITPTVAEAETVCRQIRTAFAPVDEDEDTRLRHALTGFGYLSVHFVVHFRADQTVVLGVAIPPEAAELKLEIQVRTLLQHAHSEVTHDRLYKTGFKPPAHCEREAARAAALLEEADETFGRFVRKLDAYAGHYAAHMEGDQRQRELEILKLVLRHEKKDESKPEIALRMARLARAAWDWPGVVDALESFANVPSLRQADIQMELGNALCRLHGAMPDSRDFERGLQLLQKVANPETAGPLQLEPSQRIRQATAAGWLAPALLEMSSRRAEAQAALAKAVELMPDDPYHLVSFVEFDVLTGGTATQVGLMSPALHQAAGHCEEHIRAGIEVTRAWLTLSKIRLLLGDDTGAVESLCAASRTAQKADPLRDFQKSLARLQEVVAARMPFVRVLERICELLVGTKVQVQDWKSSLSSRKQFDYSPQKRILIVAGATAAGAEAELKKWEHPLRDALVNFQGAILTGGTNTGVCGLVARIATELNSNRQAEIQLVGYLPAKAAAGALFEAVVRTPDATDFSALESLQMWTDLLAGGVASSQVALLCPGGGEISAQELAFSWALGAPSAALDDASVAAVRFASLLARAGANHRRGMILPGDPATLIAFVALNQTINPAQWEKAGEAVHQDYLEHQRINSRQPNLRPWPLLREDFKHSNRHQAASAVEILRRAGFVAEAAGQVPAELSSVQFTAAEIETMAEMEHGRWNTERLDGGWRFAETKDEERKTSPYLVAWEKLPEQIRNYDRDAIRALPGILAQAGFTIRRKLV